MSDFMKGFNAFQMVSGFSLLPFGISWLSDQTFRGSAIAFWVACVVYLVCFLMMTSAVFVAAFEDNR